MCAKNPDAVGILHRCIPFGVMETLFAADTSGGADALSFTAAADTEDSGVGLGAQGDLWWDPSEVCKVRDAAQRDVAEHRVKVRKRGGESLPTVGPFAYCLLPIAFCQ